jgi:hypothetical protein
MGSTAIGNLVKGILDPKAMAARAKVSARVRGRWGGPVAEGLEVRSLCSTGGVIPDLGSMVFGADSSAVIVPQAAAAASAFSGPQMMVAMTPAQEAGYYDRWVAYPAVTGAGALAAINDMIAQLSAMTGVEFTATTTKTTGRGIFVLKADQVSGYADLTGTYAAQLATLATKTSEGFFIASTGADRLWIVGNSDAGVANGIYHYLQQLGWRALLPNAKWTITPQRAGVTITANNVIDSSMIQHTFFSTGGYGHGVNGGLPADPSGLAMAEWEAWKTRNRFGGSVSLGGHNYAAFFTENQSLLKERTPAQAPNATYHPEYMASEDGNHYVDGLGNPNSVAPYWNPYAWDVDSNKPNYGNAGLQNFYANWVASKFGANLANSKLTAAEKWAFSVEPSDGTQYGLESESLGLGSVSDRVFALANKAAQKVDEMYPGVGKVSLLAYSGHAAVPSAAIEDNVYVTVAPYAFHYQSTGLTGPQLMQAWADKMVSNPTMKGIYDYWTLIDSASLFSFTNFKHVDEVMGLANAMGYTSLQLESSNSGALAGVALYEASQLVWNPTSNPAAIQAIRDEFYNLAFGPAAQPMKRMIERWGNDPDGGTTLSEVELGLSLRDVNAARAMAANDAASLARVNDYAKFVHFMSLYVEYKNTTQLAAGTTARHNAADALLEFLWRMDDTRMMASYRVSFLMVSTTAYDFADTTLKTDWALNNPAAAGWGRVKTAGAITDGELTALLIGDTSEYQVLFERPNYSSTLTAVNPNYTLGAGWDESHDNRWEQDGTFYVKPALAGVGATLAFQIRPGTGGLPLTDTAVVSVLVKDPAGTVVFSMESSQENVWVPFNVPIETAGNYTIVVGDTTGKNWRLRAKQNLPLVFTTPYLLMNPNTGPLTYFNVPTGVSDLYLYSPGNFDPAHPELNFKVWYKDNSNVTQQAVRTFGSGPGLARYTVPAGLTNRVFWFTGLQTNKQGMQLFNVPNVYALSAAGMMLPGNLAPKVDAGFDATVVSPSNLVDLNGTVVDDGLPTGSPTTTAWTKVSGPGTVTFGNASLVNTSATFSATGTYVLRLTATDGQPLQGVDEVTINYLALTPNKAPVVDAGLDKTIMMPTSSVVIDATVTDDGLPAVVTYKWTKVKGPGTVWFSSEATVDTTANFDAPGEYVLRLTATDSALSKYDEIKVKVLADPHAPMYKVGDPAVVGNPDLFDYGAGTVLSVTPLLDQHSARFRALEGVTGVDSVYLRLLGVTAGSTKIVVGIQADDGNGNPTGTYLASTDTVTGVNAVVNEYWYVFTQGGPLMLEDGKVYHIVTKVLSSPTSITMYRSGSTSQQRPYDRAYDPMFSSMVSADSGATWTAHNNDPYFTLGKSGGTVAVAGPGNPYTVAGFSMVTGGGTNGASTAMGQKFKITLAEAAANTRVMVSNIQLTIVRSATAPGQNMIVKLRKTLDGPELARAIITPAMLPTTAATTLTLNWMDPANPAVARPAGLIPDQTYYITTEFAAGTANGTTYSFKEIHTDTTLNSGPPVQPGQTFQNVATWGGTTVAVPVLSGTSNVWTSMETIYPGREHMDLLFKMDGAVVMYDPVYTNGQAAQLGNYRPFDYGFAAMTLNSVDDQYAATFKPQAATTVRSVFQRLAGVDTGTQIEVGIMADDGTGKPDGRYIVSTGAYAPSVGGSSAWADFTQAVTLEAMKTYHLVTRPVVATGDGFQVYRSNTSQTTRPYDGFKDVPMKVARKVDGGLWTVDDFDPYFVFAGGTGGTNVVGGVGQAVQTTASHLITTGGTGKAQGQQFVINVGEIPAGNVMRASTMRFQIGKTGTPTGNLMIDVREVQPGGSNVVLGTITVTPANADNTARSFAFDGGGTVDFVPGRTYLITPRFVGTASQTYYFLDTYVPSTPVNQAAATWGGAGLCVPIESGTSQNWGTVTAVKDWADMWFRIDGTVVTGVGLAGVSSMMAGGGGAAVGGTVGSGVGGSGVKKPGVVTVMHGGDWLRLDLMRGVTKGVGVKFVVERSKSGLGLEFFNARAWVVKGVVG